MFYFVLVNMAGSYYVGQYSLKLLKFNIEYINVMKLLKP